MIAAIIPAAGASARMGTTKALLKFRGTTFLGTILDSIRAVGLHPVVVVVGHDRDKILASHDLRDVISIESGDLEAGAIGSVKAGIRAIVNYPVEAALIWHVDRPHVGLDTVRTLVDRERLDRAAIVLPTYRGRRGHPVVFGRQVFSDLLAVPAGEGARWVVRWQADRVEEVPVEDAAVLDDIGTPEAYQALLRRLDATWE